MMKKLLFTIFLLIVCLQQTNTYGWTRHSIGNILHPIYLIVDDIDEDGDLDVAAGSISSGDGLTWVSSEVAWFENTGGTNFVKRVIYPDNPPPIPIHNAQGLVCADFDRDGQKDIAVASGQYVTSQGGVHWFKSPASFQETFWTHFDVLPEAPGNSFFKIYVLDANEDSWPDLIAGGNNGAFIFLNPTNPESGGLWEQIPLTPQSGSTINLTDINQDGKTDILNTMLRTPFTNEPIDITDQGTGIHTILNDTKAEQDDFLPADIDITLETITVSPSFYANCESGDVAKISTTGTLPSPLSSSYEYYIVKTGTVNRIQIAKRSGEVSWFKVINTGDNVTVERIIIDPDIMMPFDANPIDINGDTYPDVAVSTFIPEKGIYWYENPGMGGGVWIKNVVNIDFNGSDMFNGDINCDGKEDLVASALFANRISWFEYEWIDSTAIWTEYQVDPAIGLPGDISLNDLDEDNDLDIIVNAINDDEVIWYENTLAPCIPTVVKLAYFEAIPERSKVTLRWATESEIETAGFNVYRAENSIEGEYVKINPELVPSEGSTSTSTTYEFTDSDIQRRKNYYYKLEDIDVHGNITVHGPVSATKKRVYKK